MPSELLLPATDAGAIGQMIAVAVLTVTGAVLLRRRREPRVFVVGVGVAVFALMSLRTLH